MLRRKFIFIALLLTLSVSLLAVAAKVIGPKKVVREVPAADLPPLQEEYTRLMKKYMSPDSAIRLNGEVVLYDGAQPGVVKERSPFTYARSGSNFYSSFSFQKTYFNGKMLVQVDSLHKIVIIATVTDSARKAQARTIGASGFPGLSDKLFADTSGFRITGTVNGDDKQRNIVISSDFNPEIKQCTLYYSPVNYSMKSAEISFYKSGRQRDEGAANDDVWISRIEYREAPKEPLDVDAMIGTIFSVQKNTLIPTPEYFSYRVIIQ